MDGKRPPVLSSGRLSSDSKFRFMGLHRDKDWIRLYEAGSFMTEISAKFGVSPSTVRRHLLASGVHLRDGRQETIRASTKYLKHPFSGDELERAYLCGFIEDCHVRRSGNLVEVGTTTTHPAMEALFRSVFQRYGPIYRLASFDHLHSYYRYQLATYLEPGFKSVLLKGPDLPTYVRKEAETPSLLEYLAGLIDAEGGIQLYKNHRIADSVLHITISKYQLLRTLKEVVGGRLYVHERAWRLVFYGKNANHLLDRLNLRHEEKIAKSLFVRGARGRPWNEVEVGWARIINGIRSDVLSYREQAKNEYCRIHGRLHPKDSGL